MRASKPRATPVREDDSTLVRVLEASIEILKTENEILRRRLAAAETWAAQVVITKRLAAKPLDAPAPAEPEPRRSWARWWFGFRQAG
jgi:hypothetical protein